MHMLFKDSAITNIPEIVVKLSITFICITLLTGCHIFKPLPDIPSSPVPPKAKPEATQKMLKPAVTAPEKITVTSADNLEKYYDSIGYSLEKNPDIIHQIPRIRFSHVPSGWKTPPVSLKTSLFFRSLLPGILEVNNQLLADRARLEGITTNSPSENDIAWIKTQLKKYKLPAKGPVTEKDKKALLDRIDIIPPSLALVQSAIESGWGTSRFAREGNALFGQWTKTGGIKAKGSSARLASFDTPRQSIMGYTININSHKAYADLRKVRAEMRAKGITISGYDLADGLGSYSEKGQTYVRMVQKMIKRYNLAKLDTAVLSTGPEITILAKSPRKKKA